MEAFRRKEEKLPMSARLSESTLLLTSAWNVLRLRSDLHAIGTRMGSQWKDFEDPFLFLLSRSPLSRTIESKNRGFRHVDCTKNCRQQFGDDTVCSVLVFSSSLFIIPRVMRKNGSVGGLGRKIPVVPLRTYVPDDVTRLSLRSACFQEREKNVLLDCSSIYQQRPKVCAFQSRYPANQRLYFPIYWIFSHNLPLSLCFPYECPCILGHIQESRKSHYGDYWVFFLFIAVFRKH